MRTKRAAAFAAPMLALALVATACSGGGGGEQEDAPSLEDIAASDLNPTPREELQEGGTLVYGTSQPVSQYMRHHTDGNLGALVEILKGVMPSAFRFNDKGEATPNEDYVTDFQINDDNTEMSFELNEDAVWSNGEPITWEDYEQQAKTLGGKEEGDFGSPGKVYGYDRIDKVEKGDDDYSFTVTFDEPFGEYGMLFELLYPKEIMEDPKKFNEDYLDDVPITGGPFNFKEIDKASDTTIIERNDDWWGEPALLDEIHFQPGDPQGQAQAFANGELDIFYVGYEAAVYETASAREDGHVTQAVDNGYRYIEMNASSPILEDLDVRHAVMLGVDRTALAQVSLEGINWPSDPTVNRLLRSSDPYFQDNSGEWGQQDQDRARELLDKAGWTLESEEEGAVRTNEDGDELNLRFYCPAGIAACEAEAQITQEQLAEIGIKVTTDSFPTEAYFNDYIYTGDFDLGSFVQIGSTPYSGESAENFTGPFDDKGEDWGNNNARTSTPEINEKFEELSKTSDPEEYGKIANEIDTMLWENAQGIPFFQRTGTYAVADKVANMGASGLQSGWHYEDIGFTE
ncbi:ABC transporter family substrate-binding protein [Nocardiopsis composta]|uniref:Peptide/nickel transport system substrate-binding protein n=1 Tax=Nocardiopsis composta TaxID=157465 RepID=A0A7W8QLG4_9ACTN|nr:ABC transporter family substrate-binding protein [Nocardiopsis composta]MBB5432439.1 peptide/nickel transport system substrate-binding protein [Nocardiopsis composta]